MFQQRDIDHVPQAWVAAILISPLFLRNLFVGPGADRTDPAPQPLANASLPATQRPLSFREFAKHSNRFA